MVSFLAATSVIAVVILPDPSNLHDPCCFGAGIKIDFAGTLGQNDQCWRWSALGLGLTLRWTNGGARGEAHKTRMQAELPSAVFLDPMRHLRQPGDRDRSDTEEIWQDGQSTLRRR